MSGKKFTVNWEIPNSNEFESNAEDAYSLDNEIDEELLRYEFVYTKSDDVWVEIFCNSCKQKLREGYGVRDFEYPIVCDCGA